MKDGTIDITSNIAMKCVVVIHNSGIINLKLYGSPSLDVTTAIDNVWIAKQRNPSPSLAKSVCEAILVIVFLNSRCWVESNSLWIARIHNNKYNASGCGYSTYSTKTGMFLEMMNILHAAVIAVPLKVIFRNAISIWHVLYCEYTWSGSFFTECIVEREPMMWEEVTQANVTYLGSGIATVRPPGC